MIELEDFAKHKFKNKEDEIAFLKKVIEKKENEINADSVVTQEEREQAVKTLLKEYLELGQQNPKPLEKVALPESQFTTTLLGLSLETHDTQIQKLIDIFISEGLFNALTVLEKLGNIHLEDDFHRFLVQYVLNHREDATKKFGAYRETLENTDSVLFEVVIKNDTEQKGEHQNVQNIISLMERFYASMTILSDVKDVANNKNHFSVEIAKPAGDSRIRFFTSVPRKYSELLQKQIHALYPKARVVEQKDDFNIFFAGGYTASAYGTPHRTPALPIKRYKEFSSDPISVSVSVFSKLKKIEEGASIQIVVRPAGEKFLKDYTKILDKVRNGESLKKVLSDATFWGATKSTIGEMFEGEKKDKEKKSSYEDDEAIRLIGEKLNSTIFNTNIRVLSSAQSGARAESVLKEIKSSFNQFTEAKGNSIDFKDVKERETHRFLKHFIYRHFDEAESYPLNLEELATIAHFPEGLTDTDFSELSLYESKQAPASENVTREGVTLGKNKYRQSEVIVKFKEEDRFRHFYCLGQTGTGKTTLLKNMIIQDIQNGEGVCFIDPHGSDVEDILKNIPKERLGDVIYFDPADVSRPIGLNMLEYDTRFPEQKIFVVNELLAIFNKLFDMKVSGGPQFEQYFRNAAMLVMEHPESGATLMEISRVMADAEFRRMKLSHCKNPLVTQFWRAAEATSGEQGLENYVPYITSKFDGFLSNDIMRPIIVQEKSSINFRDIMDERKIFLVNLSKGRLGELNANLLGLILVGKFLMAALSRDTKQQLPGFYLYIDEFQNITTNSISQILSEARKYKLSLNIAHQFIAQLEEDTKKAVFGNVGSICTFRVSSEDAEFLEKQFQPTFGASDIMKLENRNAYIKMLCGGTPEKPFNLLTMPPEEGDESVSIMAKELSSLRYGTAKEDVDALIMHKFNL